MSRRCGWPRRWCWRSSCWIAALGQEACAKKIVIGLVAKSQSNPVFQAAYAGAKDAAQELGPKYGVEVVIDWQTPPDEDAQKQAEAIEQLAPRRRGRHRRVVLATPTPSRPPSTRPWSSARW